MSFIVIAQGSEITRAQETERPDRYRVELLVLMHLNHGEAPEEMPWIRDYSEALNFLTPAVEEEEVLLPPECLGEDESTAQDRPPAVEPDAEEFPIVPEVEEEVDIEEPPPDPNAVIYVEEMSDVMADAWRRLRLSAPFRPLQYLSWEQGSNEPFPILRIHDQDVVLVDDPFADLREKPEDEEGVADDTDEGEPLDALSDTTEVTEPDPCAPPEETPEENLPDPTLYYGLDGSASLVRSRFLHLHLDLQLRQPLYDPPDVPMRGLPPADTMTGSAEGTDSLPVPKPSGFLVYALEQSRQVRTARMEYFDDPVLGVLAYITRLEADPETD